ncbi:MAG: hypothetical protein AT718_06105 [Vulcanisaeta sp. JCHS_4]|jgi:hypothetical protein|nr:MAG: hypothetical protein AT718_06105 [Vulcanisaeta sp. JCHS_4]
MIGTPGVASGVLGTMRFTGQLLSITVASAILINYLGRYAALYLFTGIALINTVIYQSFLLGLKGYAHYLGHTQLHWSIYVITT